MKKFMAIARVVLMALPVFAACSNSETYEIALVTDVGNIDDKSFNEGAWNGVKEYAEANGISYNYYRPSEDTTAARVETITTAVEKGAKVVVCPGYLFEEAIYQVQDMEQYANVQFLLLDGEPHDADYNYKTGANVHCILYQEEQAGFFAGYAAVMDGYRSLGFLGGMSVPAVQRFGYGFVQGCDAAAEALGLNANDVTIKYWYSGVFTANDDIKTKMSGWYTEGVEVVFACGGGIYLSAVQAATEANGKVIGVDVDQSSESELIITSAMKGLTDSVKIALTDLYANEGKWPEDQAGKTATLGAAQNCVGLPTAEGSWRFNTFTIEQYNELFTKVVNGEIVVSADVSAAPAVKLVSVDYQA